MLRFFSFLILFLLVLRCAACPAQERPIITFASSNWVPFTYEDERGDAQGLYINILKEIFVKQLGFDLTFQIFPWKRAQYNLQKLQLVAVTNIGNEWHKDNIDRFTATTQYVTNEASAFRIVAAKRAE